MTRRASGGLHNQADPRGSGTSELLLLLGLAAGACALAGGAFGAASCFVFAVAGSAILFRTGAGSEEQGATGGKESDKACHELDRLNLDYLPKITWRSGSPRQPLVVAEELAWMRRRRNQRR